MRTLLIICVLGLFSILAFAQQFQLEATIDKSINEIFDIDGDGICEYIADTNKVYDGSTHMLKYTFPAGSLSWTDETSAQNPYSNFPHIDYNSDGNREIIAMNRTPSGQFITSIIVYDLINNQTLFEFDPLEDNAIFRDLVDIDGDGFLELILGGITYNYPNTDIRKTYIYSTGVTTSTLENPIINQNSRYQLQQNYPNPFNPSTKIEYSISEPSIVRINIYNINGELIKELINEEKNNGNYSVIWNGKDNKGIIVASGTYFYQIQVGDYVQAKKMILLK